MQMTAIEHREIKGITFKLAVVIITCTITLTSSILGVYFDLKDGLKQVIATQELRRVQSDSKFENIDFRLNTIQKTLDHDDARN